MKPQINISECVQKRLECLKEPCLGSLYGIFVKNSLLVLGLQLDSEENLNLANNLPAEVDLCGIFEAFTESPNTEYVKKKAKQVDVTDNPAFIAVKLASSNQIFANIISNNQIDSVKYSISTEQEIYTDFLHVHLKGAFNIKSEPTAQNVADSFTLLRKSIASGCMAFTVDNKNIILVNSGHPGSETGVIGLSDNPTLGEICEEASESAEDSGRKKKRTNLKLDIIEMKMLKQTTVDHFSGEHHHCPVVIVDRKHAELLNLNIKIDFLALIHKQNQLSTVYPILLECAIRNLRLYESAIQQKLANQTDEKLGSQKYIPKILHFFPKDCGHFLSKVDLGELEELQRKDRELLHQLLLLNVDVPRFRRANQYSFQARTKSSNLLINPHEGVKPTDNGGKICLVKGKYEYYHYCQNNMDDNGWGCAYRSLQTLASWYKLQGYTEKGVPSFKDIQKCLVDIGDKPSNFIGSRQWIGSTEVSFVLNTLLGVTSKILFVSSGEEMGTKGPELVNHFENHGSPIMIGGGVLAHTILGVDYNQQLGTLKFLILDPHYTGGEDLHTIQSKGWCGWKGVEFWNKTAYYNMCMPQVPREI